MRFILINTILVLIFNLGCEESESGMDKHKEFTIKNDTTFLYDLEISGDEEGATIKKQALHYEISELYRDSSTDWSIVYKYVPESDYVGSDYVEIETCTGGTGVSYSNIGLIKISFDIIE